MELQEYLDILKKRWILVVVITLVATILSGIVSFFIVKPSYKSDISVIIHKQDNTNSQNTSLSYNDVMMYQNLVKTYSQLVNSRTVAEDAIQKLGLNMSVGTLQKMISVTPQANTEFLTISVKSKNAKQAMDIANQLAKSLKDVSVSVMNSDNVKILDLAQMPTSPDSPRPKLNMAIAFFLGLMISVGVIFLLEYLDNTIKTPADIEKLMDIPVIGTIPFVAESKE